MLLYHQLVVVEADMVSLLDVDERERGDTLLGLALLAATLGSPRVPLLSPSLLPVLRYLTLICFRYSPRISGISSIIISSSAHHRIRPSFFRSQERERETIPRPLFPSTHSFAILVTAAIMNIPPSP